MDKPNQPPTQQRPAEDPPDEASATAPRPLGLAEFLIHDWSPSDKAPPDSPGRIERTGVFLDKVAGPYFRFWYQLCRALLVGGGLAAFSMLLWPWGNVALLESIILAAIESGRGFSLPLLALAIWSPKILDRIFALKQSGQRKPFNPE